MLGGLKNLVYWHFGEDVQSMPPCTWHGTVFGGGAGGCRVRIHPTDAHNDIQRLALSRNLLESQHHYT